MTAQLAFKELVDTAIVPALKQEGFRRVGQSFYLRWQQSWGVINIQKSGKSSAEEVIFAINLGTALDSVLGFFHPELEGGRPVLDQCQWKTRLAASRSDSWWLIDPETSMRHLGDECRTRLQTVALPEIRTWMRADTLRDLWLSGSSPGLTRLQRLQYLAVLLKRVGPQDLLPPVLADLQSLVQGKPTEAIIQHHINKLERLG